jgi:hypothetical protein
MDEQENSLSAVEPATHLDVPNDVKSDGTAELMPEDSWGDLDESLLDPQQQSLNFVAKTVGILLISTWLIPIGRTEGAPVNVWDTFGVASTLDVTRLILPGFVGVLFVALGFFIKLDVKRKATIMSASLLLMLVLGVNPFAVLSVVTPPIDGRVAELLFGMVEGSYFPREGVWHLALLGLGLGLFGVAGRYRVLVQTSPLGGYLMVAAAALLVAYYVWPYPSGKVPAARNVELYKGYHEFPARVQAGVRALENELYQMDPEIIHSSHFKKIGRDARLLGQVKLSAVYFLCIYFVPLVLVFIAIPALKPSRYLNHRTVPAKLVSWGSSTYLMAFLFPLLLKESGKVTGDGFLAALRNYILFVSIFTAATVAVSSALREWVEPDKSNDALPPDPLSWKEM